MLMVIEVTAPAAEMLAVAVACVPPAVCGAVIVTTGAAVYPLPPAVTVIKPTDEAWLLAALVPVPHVQPHIGTVLPSGSVVVCCWAVRFTVWAYDMPVVARRTVIASIAAFSVSFR
jgi:hypothetical protein